MLGPDVFKQDVFWGVQYINGTYSGGPKIQIGRVLGLFGSFQKSGSLI